MCDKERFCKHLHKSRFTCLSFARGPAMHLYGGDVGDVHCVIYFMFFDASVVFSLLTVDAKCGDRTAVSPARFPAKTILCKTLCESDRATRLL